MGTRPAILESGRVLAPGFPYIDHEGRVQVTTDPLPHGWVFGLCPAPRPWRIEELALLARLAGTARAGDWKGPMAGATLQATFDTSDEEARFLTDLQAFVVDHPGVAGSFSGDHLAPVGDLTAPTDALAGAAADVPAGAAGAPGDLEGRVDRLEEGVTALLDHFGIGVGGTAAGAAGASGRPAGGGSPV